MEHVKLPENEFAVRAAEEGNNLVVVCSVGGSAKQILFSTKEFSKLDSPSPICELECTSDEAFFLTEDGKVFSSSFSKIKLTQVCASLQDNFIVSIACGKTHVLLLDSNNDLFSFGKNEKGW